MSSVYAKAKEAFLSGALNLTTSNIKIVLLTSAYVYSDSHQFLSDLPARIATSDNLTSITVSNGAFDADDITIPTVPVGFTIKSIVGYKDTGAGSTSPLLFFIDGMSQDTSGGDITVQWDAVAKIFTL